MLKIENEKTSSNNRFSEILTVIAFLVFGVLLVAAYKFKELLKPNVAVTMAVDESCDLRKGPCTSNLPHGGKVSFTINPNDIQILKPLILQVKTEGVEVSNVEVDFIGVGMEMGYNRSKLTEIEKKKYSGKGMLPVCSSERMDWEARVLLQTDDGLVVAPFRFHTIK
jgi:hypothetical protein